MSSAAAKHGTAPATDQMSARPALPSADDTAALLDSQLDAIRAFIHGVYPGLRLERVRVKLTDIDEWLRVPLPSRLLAPTADPNRGQQDVLEPMIVALFRGLDPDRRLYGPEIALVLRLPHPDAPKRTLADMHKRNILDNNRSLGGYGRGANFPSDGPP